MPNDKVEDQLMCSGIRSMRGYGLRIGVVLMRFNIVSTSARSNPRFYLFQLLISKPFMSHNITHKPCYI